MKQFLHHRSPNLENRNTIFQTPIRKRINIINIDKQGSSFKNRNSIIRNQFNYNYTKNENDYYDEITKAFNFITFVLKQKDNQIKELKLKINNLKRQLNEINEENMNSFSNKDLINFSPHMYSLDFKNKNNINTISPYNEQSKMSQLMNNFWKSQEDFKYNTFNNSIYNFNKNNNYINEKFQNKMSDKIIFDKKNIFNKIKNCRNDNKITNYGKNKKILNNTININNSNQHIKGISNNHINLNMNINEHSIEKKNINKIRKVSYHSNININLQKKNNENKKIIKNGENKNLTKESQNINEENKIKTVNFDNSAYALGRSGSKNNSLYISDNDIMIFSKKDVKNYLKEVKIKLEPEKFKKFITNIKALTKKKNIEQKNAIIIQIKNLLVDKILINKFESIMKINKN